MESIIKGPRATRGVVGTLYDPSSYSNRRCRHTEGICPEPTRFLHVMLLWHGLQKASPSVCKYKAMAFCPSHGEVPSDSHGEVPSDGTKLSWPRLFVYPDDRHLFADSSPPSLTRTRRRWWCGARASSWTGWASF